MPRKSSIKKLDPQVRSHIERCLREDRLTLDELIAELEIKYPSADRPSRSALGRFRVGFDQMMEKTREQEMLGRALVEELGENPDDRAGALMMQSLTTLMNQVSFQAQEDPDLAIDDVRKLARAARDVISARKLSRDERKQIASEARDRLLQEQEARLEEVRGTDGMSEQLESRIRGILLGKA